MSRRSKKKFAKRKPRGLGTVFLFFFLFLLAVPVLAGGWFFATFDRNAWRERIAQAVSEHVGREVRLTGPVEGHFSFERGVGLSVSGVTVANPSWASRQDMARIGEARLFIDVKALLEKKLSLMAFELVDADVQLETDSAGVGNWVFKKKDDKNKKKKAAETVEEKPQVDASGASIAVHLREVKILQSRFGLRGKNGKLVLFDVPELILEEGPEGLRAHFRGSVASIPVDLALTGGKVEAMAGSFWPFTFLASYADARIEGRGGLKDGLKKIVFDKLGVTGQSSQMVGTGEMALDGPKLFLQAKIKAEKLDLDDFVFKASEETSPIAATGREISEEKAKENRIFSRERLSFDGLTSLDANVDLAIAELVSSPVPLQNVVATVSLKNGLLLVSPLSFGIAGSRMEGQAKLDAASSEAKASLVLKGNRLEFAKLFDFASVGDVISGKVDLTLDLSSFGQSSYDFASRANGRMDLLMDTGTVSSGAVKGIAASLVDIFLPGVRSLASPGINCMAARYKITNGLVETSGLLIDMDNTTVSGSGTINLPDEHISMYLRTRPKGVGLGAIVPPMKIYGALMSPELTLDASGALQKVAGLLTNSEEIENGVPKMLHIEGKNDCTVTLDNPALARKMEESRAKPLLPGPEPLTEAVKGIGGKLLQGLGKGLMGP